MTEPIPVLSADPDDPIGPVPCHSVAVHNGEIELLLAMNDELGDGPCDTVRTFKKFLTTSLEPGVDTYVVIGAAIYCEGRLLEVRGDGTHALLWS